ncbi:MAG: T9SS type A sorting domain-containing protein [Chitinophagaceae bacterium]|nr:T9SS type A sorting domain-containing protein [Chitinophagaceae bacterium]MCB9047340.1 T9SS type A sorting domain-containing protein [Chitinophagales bacterium]
MKRIYLLMILFVAFAANSFAQRTSDIKVTLASPTSSTILTAGGSFNVDAIVTNLGPDSIKYTGDSILWYMAIQNSLVNLSIGGQSGTTWLRYHKPLKTGDTLHITFTGLTPSNYTGAADSQRTFCFFAFPRGPQGDTIADPNMTPISTSNNRACATFLWKKTVGIEDIQGVGANSVKVFPNPASYYTQVAFENNSPATVKLVVLDVTGRTVLNVDKGTMNAGQHNFRVDTDKLRSGIYVYQLYVGSDLTTGKLTIQ